MPQKHDIGWKKRQAAEKPTLPTASPEGLARSLVARGLASAQILSPRKASE
ncbi:hypothetical protein V1639_08925 [Pseudarthrobacter sp. J75]|uniref:hypothetical protein n=1 Tax=Pseudarthrobacter sp. J75 TaxID=3116486 RepID=UPI002E80405D|nr:hypothetical protein [Pseudarthrobacter sp. J75]MEE2529151.1 hypothetical protein [Pseudarthrobacter sp. J75]